MNQETVVLSHLTIGYKTKKQTHIVGKDMSASIRQGELTCLLGENGVGKSTLLRTLASFLPPLEGTISLMGRRLEHYNDDLLARTIGVVLTEKPDLGEMTARELVALGRSPYTDFWGRMSEDDRQATSEAIAMVGIGSLADRPVQTLSDGERQKVMIAKTLAQQTPIIILDEPTAFLDYPSKVDMMRLLQHICREQQKTVFLSTHDLELALQVADTVWLMDREEGLVSGSPRDLADRGILARFVERSPGVQFCNDTLSVKVLEA